MSNDRGDTGGFGDRTEFGHLFHWDEHERAWVSTSGNKVLVLPPDTPTQPWLLMVEDDEPIRFSGHDAEKRAFVVAEGFTRQNRTRPDAA